MDFISFFRSCLNIAPHLCLDVGYSSITDYCISVHEKKSKSTNWGEPLFTVQSCDWDLVQAEAYCKLAEWMSDNKGGY